MPSPDELILSVLCGESATWPWTENEVAASEALHAAAELHGVQSLLHSKLNPGDWPASAYQRLRESAIQHAIWELGHQELLARTLTQLQCAGIQPILIKGTALAYSSYSNPALRTRSDTDLIIAAGDRDRVHDILLALGYERSAGMSGEFVSYQASYCQTAHGGTHALDLHWKINNSELLSRLFTYEELLAGAEPMPSLCACAIRPSRVHSLLLACMHRSTHKQNPYRVGNVPVYEGNRLIWLHDIHLLAQALTEREWHAFSQLARDKGLRTVCLDGMHQARTRFHTRVPGWVAAGLSQPQRSEAPGRYLDSSKLRQQWMDFWALSSTRDRLRFLRELLAPPADYMRARFPPSPSGWLPWLYMRRALRGVVKRWKT